MHLAKDNTHLHNRPAMMTTATAPTVMLGDCSTAETCSINAERSLHESVATQASTMVDMICVDR